MTESIIELTSGLHELLLTAERALARSRRDIGASVVALRERALRLSDGLKERAQRLSDDLHGLRASAGEQASGAANRAATHLRELATVLGERCPSRERVDTLFAAIARDYEALAATIRTVRGSVPRHLNLSPLKPKNYARNLFHISMGLSGVFTYELFLNRSGAILVLGCLFASFVILDVLRRVSTNFNDKLIGSVFSTIVRPNEAHTIPAATWYIVALFVGVIAYPQMAIEMGVVALALGDPAANLVGKRFGSAKIRRQKSWAGLIGFLCVSFLALMTYQALCAPDLGWAQWTIRALAVAAAGAIAEVLSDPIDDNLLVPLVAGAAAWAVM